METPTIVVIYLHLQFRDVFVVQKGIYLVDPIEMVDLSLG